MVLPAPAPTVSASTRPQQPLEGPLGYQELPETVEQRAVDLNSKGLEQHRRQDFEASRRDFERALLLAPQYSLAEFNLACALVRLGRNAEAGDHLTRLLERDLPEYGPRLFSDADLKSLLGSSEGKALLQRFSALKRRWLTETARGIGAALYRGFPLQGASEKDWVNERPPYLRFGAYVPKLGRFLPLLPKLEQSIAGVVDPKTGAAAVLTGSVVSCTTDFCPRLSSPELVYWPGFEPERKLDASRDRGRTPELSVGSLVHLRLDTGAARWQIPPAPQWFAAAPAGAPATGEPTSDVPELTVAAVLGATLSGTPRGFTLKGRTLITPKAPIELPGSPSEFVQLALSPDQKWAVLIRLDAGCECDAEGAQHSWLKHSVIRLDLESGSAESWLSGKGAASAQFAPSGEFYLQRGDIVEKLDPAHPSEKPAPVLHGLVLAPTLPSLSGDCCGL